MQIEKGWNQLQKDGSLACFKNFLKISHSNYLQFFEICIFLKVTYFLTVFIVFYICKQGFTA